MSKAALICRECGGKNYTGGLCHKHHRAAINRGETVQLARPSTGATKGMSPAERLAHYGQVNAETGCIEWTGSLFATGYGKLTVDGKTVLAHRAAYECEHGSIPAGQNVLHRCDNRRCINTGHHFLGSLADNSHDRNLKDRQSSILTRADVEAILTDTRPHGPVADQYGVTYQVVLGIRGGRKWKHVPRPDPPVQYERFKPGPSPV